MKRLRALLSLALVLVPAVLLAEDQPQPAPGTITVQQLMSPASHSLIGKTVTLWYQPVQGKADHSILIGPSASDMVLVAMPGEVHVLDPDGRPVKLNDGDHVQVKGILVQVPNEYQLHKGWGVSTGDVALVQRAGVIVLAQSVTLIRQNN